MNLLRVEIIELEAQNEKNAIRITDLLSDTKNKRLGLEGTISLAKNEDEKLAKQTLPCIEKAVKDISECKKLLKLLQQQNEFEYVSLTKEVVQAKPRLHSEFICNSR